MKMTPLKPKPNWNITPDPNNSNNHCDSCNRTYTSKGNYRQHLIRMHKLIIPPKFQRTTANPNVLPDIDDPNYYCKSCQITCKDRRHYRIHFWIKHQMEMKLLRKQAKFDPAITVHDTKSPNNQSCAICKLIYSSQKTYIQQPKNLYTAAKKLIYSSQKTYRKHMKKYHEDGEHTPTIRNKVTPNPTSSLILKTQHSIVARAKNITQNRDNFHKHVCFFRPDTKLGNIRAINPSMVEVDTGNIKNKRCTICEKDHSSRGDYKEHMRTVHKDGRREPARTSKGRIEISIIPLWDDPSHYCRSCRKTYSTNFAYQRHIKRSYNDVLQEVIQLSLSKNPTL